MIRRLVVLFLCFGLMSSILRGDDCTISDDLKKCLELIKQNDASGIHESKLEELLKVYHKQMQTEGISSTTRFCVDLEIIRVLFPLYKNAQESQQRLEKILNIFFKDIRELRKDKLVSDELLLKLRKVIGSYSFKCVILNGLELATMHDDKLDPLSTIDQLLETKKAFKPREVLKLVGDVDYFLYADENSVGERVSIMKESLKVAMKAVDFAEIIRAEHIEEIKEKTELELNKNGWYDDMLWLGASAQELRRVIVDNALLMKASDEGMKALMEQEEFFKKHLKSNEFERLFQKDNGKMKK